MNKIRWSFIIGRSSLLASEEIWGWGKVSWKACQNYYIFLHVEISLLIEYKFLDYLHASWYKDTLRVFLKSFRIDCTTWETVAQYQTAWGVLIREGVVFCEQSRIEAAQKKCKVCRFREFTPSVHMVYLCRSVVEHSKVVLVWSATVAHIVTWL